MIFELINEDEFWEDSWKSLYKIIDINRYIKQQYKFWEIIGMAEMIKGSCGLTMVFDHNGKFD